MVVVEAVGARLRPQASRSTEQSRANVAGLGERGVQVAAEADEGVALALEGGEEAEDLLGLAGGGESDDYVAGHQHAEVAVDGFSRVEEEGREPVELKVAAIFWAMSPLLPMPVTDDATIGCGAGEDQLDGAVEISGHGAV